MKRLILLLITWMSVCALHAQTDTENYILSRRMLRADSTAYIDHIAYHDGLGRPSVAVTKSVQNGTPRQRLAALQEYDGAGRERNAWLPTPVTADYVTAAALKNTAKGSTGYSDTRPYSETVYEASPLDRVTKQYGAGASWYSGHPVATDYLTNTVSGVLSCKLYITDGNTLSGGSGYYTAGSLYVVKTTDEDGNISYTFTDKQERTVLTRQMNGTEQLDTYFVYDVKGNLCFVLQPEYQDSAFLDKFAFQYKYDNRNRCIWKKLPGAEYISYEYNDHDQLAFSQDGNQRTSGKWTFYVYDKFNRLTQQGENTSKAVSSTSVYLQNYYDDYSYMGTTHFPSSGYNPEGAYLYSKGQLTGTLVSVFGSNQKIATMYHYDIRGRLTKTTENNLMGGYNKTATTYTFTDQPATVTLTHTANGKATQTEVYTYTYDHSDRISSVTHKLNSGSTVTLASYTYDNKGRLATKKLHGSSNNQLTYAYNIRSWLTGINSSKFTQTLGYGSHYNGNISTMNWTANGSSHSYAFTYDGVNRMLNATHGTGAYTEKVTGYDKNGNIAGLQRYGNGLIDNLTYTYNGNRLTKVEDATGNTAGFKNGASQENEYTYDANGNLTKDSNKGIASITYNSLNLPQQIQYTNGFVVNYGYSADGVKQRVQHPNSGLPDVVYCGNVIYEDGAQKFLLTEEGYVDLSASTPVYYYYLKDHQGNNRVVINGSGTVVETNHYYPFGSTFASSNVQPYKYNGKELDTANGLNWYDYGARHYDAVLGRFTTQDRFAEKYSALSPYQYGANSPVCNVDVNGDSIWYTIKDNMITMHLTAKVIDYSSDPINIKKAARDIAKGIKSTYSGNLTLNGKEYELSIDANIEAVSSMNEVSDSDHLFVIANSDGNLARGSTNMLGGKVMTLASNDYVNDNWFSNTFFQNDTFTALHEFGHAAGLEHVRGFGNVMRQKGFIKNTNSEQRRNMFLKRNVINRGSNSVKIGTYKSPYPYIHTSNGRLYHISNVGLNYSR